MNFSLSWPNKKIISASLSSIVLRVLLLPLFDEKIPKSYEPTADASVAKIFSEFQLSSILLILVK